MSRAFSVLSLLFFALLLPVAVQAQSMRPILPLNLSWKPLKSDGSLGDQKDLFQSTTATKKAQSDFKEALVRLSKVQNSADQAKDLSTLRQNASKLGPRARLLAELTAARVTAGLSAAGQKATNPSGNWRNHLLAACNIASKIEDSVHEETAQQAIALWRKVEIKDNSWAYPPIDLKAQKQFAFFKAITERQAIYDWSKAQKPSAFKKYRSLSIALNGSPDGAAIDLRLMEMERTYYKESHQLRRWQKALVDMSNKYQDQQFLGTGNESKVQYTNAALARMHKELIDSLLREALPPKASDTDRAAALKSIDLYLTTNISNDEKERVRAASGEIHFNAAHHKSSAGIFAALATESQGGKSAGYWRKAIRSQTVLAAWPVDAPWVGFSGGASEAREVLLDMYRKIDSDKAGWDVGAHIGLLLTANGKLDEAYKYWTEKLNKAPSGHHASRAAGWMVSARITAKQWSDLESLARILVKSRLIATHQSKTYRPLDVLGLSLIEGGNQALAGGDFKAAIPRLQEFVKGWRKDSRHDEGMFNLALAFQGDRQFRAAVLALEDFTKTYHKSKYRRDALVKGGDWTLGLAWDDHVVYFLEAHAKEFPGEPQTLASLRTLTDLYLGREYYDAALRVMNIQLMRKDLDPDSRVDVARRMLDTAERHSSAENAIRLAEKLQASFKNDVNVLATALSLKARIFAAKGKTTELTAIDKITSGFDQSQPSIADVVSEVRFLLAETLARGQFKEEVYSLGIRDPKVELERGYSLFSKIEQAYKAACISVRTGWCGPALHRAARVGESFVKAYDRIAIAKTLDPKIVKEFYTRKTSVLESVENSSIDADEKSMEQARSGATNPDWTSAIMWQNGGDWSREKYTGENANQFIQWRTR